MKSVTVTRMLMDSRHIVGLGYERPDGELCWSLAQAGLETKLFVGKSEASLNDLARQLARTRSDHYVFAVNMHSAPAARALGLALQQVRPTVVLAFWMELSALPADLVPLAEIGTPILAVEPGAAAAALTGTSEAPPPRTASLYRAGIFSEADLARIGLHAASNSIEDDLAWLAEAAPAGEILVDGVGAGTGEVVHLVERLEAIGLADRLTLRTDANGLSQASPGAVSRASFQRVMLEDGFKPALQAGSIDALRQMFASRTPPNALGRASMFVKNGLVAHYTGAYADGNVSPAVYHLELPLELNADDRRLTYQWAGSHMSAKSAAILLGEPQALEPELPRFTAPAHQETGGWPKHVYAVGSGARGKAWVDGEEESEFPILRSSFRALAAGEANADAMTIVTLSEADDIDALDARLSRFHETGEMEVGNASGRFHFENSCRWLGYGNCKLAAIRRMQVAANLDVMACRDAGRLGRVGEPIDQMLLASRRHQQMEEVRRGCATCPVRDACSRCANLPDAWGGRYCAMRRQYPATPLYFELWYFVRLLAEHGRPLSGANTLRVSAEGLPPQHFSGAGAPTGAPRRLVIVSIDAQHFAWMRGTRTLCRLSAPLATILEGAWMGANQENLADELASRFGAERAVAEESVAAGLAKLSAGGLLEGCGHA